MLLFFLNKTSRDQFILNIILSRQTFTSIARHILFSWWAVWLFFWTAREIVVRLIDIHRLRVSYLTLFSFLIGLWLFLTWHHCMWPKYGDSLTFLWSRVNIDTASPSIFVLTRCRWVNWVTTRNPVRQVQTGVGTVAAPLTHFLSSKTKPVTAGHWPFECLCHFGHIQRRDNFPAVVQ